MRIYSVVFTLSVLEVYVLEVTRSRAPPGSFLGPDAIGAVGAGMYKLLEAADRMNDIYMYESYETRNAYCGLRPMEV